MKRNVFTKASMNPIVIMMFKEALLGNPEALYEVGMCLSRTNIEEGRKEAVKYWRKSAELGNPDAQYALVLSLEAGTGIEQNVDEAMVWYTKAAKQGNLDTLLYAGKDLLSGEGTLKQNITLGLKWLFKAKEQKCQAASDILDSFFYEEEEEEEE